MMTEKEIIAQIALGTLTKKGAEEYYEQEYKRRRRKSHIFPYWFIDYVLDKKWVSRTKIPHLHLCCDEPGMVEFDPMITSDEHYVPGKYRETK